MKIVKAGYEILDVLNGEEVLKKIEKVARKCYKSEELIGPGTAEKMVANLIKRGHEAMLEHFSFSVCFVVDRGVSHELVRHRIASFAQESTRYCNYGNKDGGITVIEPCYLIADGTKTSTEQWSERYGAWHNACKESEKAYLRMLADGAAPQEARAVLPTSLKTEIVVTMNLREWRHFFKLRAAGVTGMPHPQMLEVTVPLLKEVQSLIPIVFDDIYSVC